MLVLLADTFYRIKLNSSSDLGLYLACLYFYLRESKSKLKSEMFIVLLHLFSGMKPCSFVASAMHMFIHFVT